MPADYDKTLDPDEAEYCQEHQLRQPCRECRKQAQVEDAEERYKEGA